MRKLSLLLAARLTLGAVTLATLSACSGGTDEPGPGGVSAGEAAALDDAAEIIEARQLPVDALPPKGEETAPLPPEIPADAAQTNPDSAPQ